MPPSKGARGQIHRTSLAEHDVGMCNGLPVTSLARTLVDLGRTLPSDIGSRIIADALRTSRVSVEAIESRIASLAGHIGIDRARMALASADPRLESVLERELLLLLRRAGLSPIAQYTVALGAQFIARVDFALPNIRLAIEADGYATHALRPGFERDHERAALLQLAGWSVLSFTATQIRQRPEWVIGVIRQRVLQLSAVNT
jgi:very-short-patch-repair endonuclease